MATKRKKPLPEDWRRDNLLSLIKSGESHGKGEDFDPFRLAEIENADRTENYPEWKRLTLGLIKREREYKGPVIRSPHLQYFAAVKILQFKREIDAGDGAAILEAIAQCVAHGLIAPPWLAYSYVERFERVICGECREWSDPLAFGSVRQAGENIAGIRAMRVHAPAAYRAALNLLIARPARPIDVGFFEEVGQVVGLSASRVQEVLKKFQKSADCHYPPLALVRKGLRAGRKYYDIAREWSGLDSDLATFRKARDIALRMGDVVARKNDIPEK